MRAGSRVGSEGGVLALRDDRGRMSAAVTSEPPGAGGLDGEPGDRVGTAHFSTVTVAVTVPCSAITPGMTSPVLLTTTIHSASGSGSVGSST